MSRPGPLPLPSRPLATIVLHQPEIPNNTGTIGRTCVAYGAALTLIHPLGFDTDEKACRRAGLDYWPRLAPREEPSWSAYVGSLAAGSERPPCWALSARAEHPLHEAPLPGLAWGDHFVFGCESRGLPDEVLDEFRPERRLVIPILPGERSINLANAVAVVLHELVRVLIGRRELAVERGRIVHRLSPEAVLTDPHAERAYPSA